MKFVSLSQCLTVGLLLFAEAALASGQSLLWDAMSKTNQVKFGVTNSLFNFSVTNLSSSEVVVNSLRTSCGCTVAKVPSLPWKLAPGASGDVQVAVDVRGKMGMLSKVVTVDAATGLQLLAVNVKIGDPDPRQRNQMMAQADRQAVFRNDCANCHAKPTVGKHGHELFNVACGICHDSEHRASMVPDLKALNKKTDAEYWSNWIRRGKPGSLMPGFEKSVGGPLEADQIQSLVDYLTTEFSARGKLDLGNPFDNPVEPKL